MHPRGLVVLLAVCYALLVASPMPYFPFALRLPTGDFKSEADLAGFNEYLLRLGYATISRDDNRGPSNCQHCTELTLVRYRC